MPLRNARWPALLTVLVVACAGPQPPDAVATAPMVSESAAAQGQGASLAPQWEQRYAALAQGGGRQVRLDPGASRLRIYAFRGGRAARLGHNHVLSAPRFTGLCYLPARSATGAPWDKAQFDLELRLDELVVDPPDVRAELAAAGDAFAAPLTADDASATRAHMLGNGGLQAAQFPFVRIHGAEFFGEPPKMALRVELELHGRTQGLWVPVTVGISPGQFTASGSFVVRQADFGITAYSALGGLLAVQDPLVLEFALAGK